MDSFDLAYQKWMESHQRNRKGERKRRLVESNMHAETEMLRYIWWPAFGDFNYLHPEYEVIDYLEGRRFIDLAYIRPPVRIAIEVDGYGPHSRDISRRQFCDQWVRQMHLLNDHWIVIRIGYDDVRDRPRLWQQLLQQMIGRFFGNAETQLSEAKRNEREVLRLVFRANRPIKLHDVKTAIPCSYRFARAIIESLVDKNWLIPTGGGTKRIHFWKLNDTNKHLPW
jgi:hypothetical protein